MFVKSSNRLRLDIMIFQKYRLVSEEHYTEYIPLYLKHFLSTIMDKPEDNCWRIHDTLKLFLKVEPD